MKEEVTAHDHIPPSTSAESECNVVSPSTVFGFHSILSCRWPSLFHQQLLAMITTANVIVSRIKHSICCCCLGGSINNPRSRSPKREEEGREESEGRVDAKREESTPGNDDHRINQESSPGKEASSVANISWIQLSSRVQSKDRVVGEGKEGEEGVSVSRLTFHHIKCTSQSILSFLTLSLPLTQSPSLVNE